MVVLGASGCEDPPPPLMGRLPQPELLLSLDSFCKTVFEAPRRHLEARCSGDEKQGKAYGFLSERAARSVGQCRVEWGLAASVEKGRAELPLNAAMSCAQALERMSWKTTMLTTDLSRFSVCANLVIGKQPARGPCQSSYECQPGLWCAGAKAGSEGRCRKPAAAGQPCELSRPLPFGAPVSSCRGGFYCGARATEERSSSPEGRYAVRGPAGGADPHLGRQALLRQAAEVGMIGLLNAGGPPAAAWSGLDEAFGLGLGIWGDSLGDPLAEGFGLGLSGMGEPDPTRGEGIGLGRLGTIGHGAGAGQGFSGPTGRLASSHRQRPPRVRLDSLVVTGRLPKEVVRRIVRQNLGRFRFCYENGLRDNPNLQGRVTVRLVIGRDGSVTNVGGGGDLPDKTVVSCVTRAFYGLRFPQPEGGIVTVSAPIVFTPGEATKRGPTGAPTGQAAASASASAAAGTASGYSGLPPGPAISPDLCIKAKKLGEPCTATAHCAAGLACRASVCRKRKLVVAGGKCDQDEDCIAGLYCDGTCKRTKATGQDCTTASECAGACGSHRKCIALCGAG